MTLLTWVLIGAGVLIVASVAVILFALWLEAFMRHGANPARNSESTNDDRLILPRSKEWWRR